MSNKTIAKFLNFVILTAVSCLLASCAFVSSDAGRVRVSPRYTTPEIVGTIQSPQVTESSGIAASRCQSDVFWTHNDSGGNAAIFAFNRSGDHLGTWLVLNSENKDWEDIATWKDNEGKCFIYIGEIGNNKLLRPEHIIYRIPEPLVSPATASAGREPAYADSTEGLRFVYPDGNKNAETLMVHPGSGDIYVLTKNESGPSSVYRMKNVFSQSREQTAEKVAELAVPAVPNGLLTGGDISPDGRNVVVCDYRQAYELSLPDGVLDFNDIWVQKPYPVELGKRKVGEAVCFGVDGTEIFATSEGRTPPIISVRKTK